MPDLQLTRIARYPVKSCRGADVPSAEVEPWGLAGDRRWMVVDRGGAVVTAREANALLLVGAEPDGSGLRLRAPGLVEVVVGRPDPAWQRPVSLWGSELTAADAGDDAAGFFTAVTGREVRLVWLDDPTRRASSPVFSRPDDRVSFADGYPLLVTTEESLAALDDAVLALVLESGGTGVAPLAMERFRPNLVLRGASAWAEDDWRRLRVGGPDGVVFRAVKGCARCVMTTVDPDTGERGREPLRTLARVRRFDSGTWFGVNLVPDVDHAAPPERRTVRVGDGVEVLDAVETGSGPLRASTVGPRDD